MNFVTRYFVNLLSLQSSHTKVPRRISGFTLSAIGVLITLLILPKIRYCNTCAREMHNYKTT